VTVPFVLPEVKCTEATEKVEKCVKVPNKECKEECTCLPQKSLTLALPKKPSLSVSLDASASAISLDASASSSSRGLKDVKIVLPSWFKELANKKFVTFPVPKLPNKPIATIDLDKKSISISKP
jgi:hypothetical protein